jgi:hypothetical protein
LAAHSKPHLNAHGNRNVGYKQAAFVRAYYSVLTEGLTVTKASAIESLLALESRP